MHGASFLFNVVFDIFFSFASSFPFKTSDIVVVNLYPFYDKVTLAGGIEFEDGIENIDIGGPDMIRATANVVCLTEYAKPRINLIS